MEPARPDGIPKEAFWHEKDKEWQLGETRVIGKVKKEKITVGKWSYWSREGYLICRAEFDEEGVLTGLLERYHPDGTLASSGEYKKGNRHGHFVHQRSRGESPESYPADYSTWRYEFDAFNNWEEKEIKYFLEDGTPCTADGRSLDSAFDLDELFSNVEPEGFLHASLEEISIRFDESRKLLRDPLKLQELWGSKNDDIDKLVSFAIAGDSFEPCDSRREFRQNIWLDLIANPFDNYREELAAAFMGAVKIGNFGDCDGVYATLFQPLREVPGPNAVYLWSHDTYYIDEVLSESLDSFAFRMALACAHEAQRLSSSVAALAWKKLEGKVNVNWGLSSGLDEACEDFDNDDAPERDDFNADLDPKNQLRGQFWRSQWIIELLNEEPDKKLKSAQECFRPGFNRAIDEGNHRVRIEWAMKLPQSAIYLLWRYFWFAQEERLAECKNAFRDHRAPIVRDLVALLDEIEAGKVEIGEIKNIILLRDQFLKLDLCPEQSDRRETEAAESKSKQGKIIESVSREAEQFSDQELEPFLDYVFSKLDDFELVAELEKRARSFPGMEMQWRILDWVRSCAYERANQDNLDEVRQLAAWLCQNDCRLIQPFVWKDLFGEQSRAAFLLLPELCRTKNVIDPRFQPIAIRQLDVPEEYRHKQSLAVMLLRALDARESLSRLMKCFDEFFKDLEGKVDFDARMAMIPWEEMLVELCRTLQSFADKGSKDADKVRQSLEKLAAFSARNYSYKICAAASEALFDWGARDILVCARLLISDNDDPSRVTAFALIEKAAAQMSARERRDIIEAGFFNPDEDSNAVTLMYYRAYHALAQGLDNLPEELPLMSVVMDLCEELSSYGGERWQQWRLLKIETYGIFAELDLENIRHYLNDANEEVRNAALAAFKKRGIELAAKKAISWIEIWQRQEQDAEITDWIAGLIDDADIPDKKLPAVWAWENPSERCGAALARCAELRLKSFEAPGAGDEIAMEFFWILKALARHAHYESCRKVLCAILEKADENILGPVFAELEHFNESFAEALIACAAGLSGWRKASVAEWLLARDGSPLVDAAVKKAGLNQKKIKSWTR